MINNSRPIVSYLREDKATRRSQNGLLGVLAAAAGCAPAISQPSKATLVSPLRETNFYSTLASSLPAVAWGRCSPCPGRLPAPAMDLATIQLGQRGCAPVVRRAPSAVEVCVQDPELLVDPARDVGVDRRTARIFDIRSERNVVSQRRGVGRHALRQRPHMGGAIHDGAGILRQR